MINGIIGLLIIFVYCTSLFFLAYYLRKKSIELITVNASDNRKENSIKFHLAVFYIAAWRDFHIFANLPYYWDNDKLNLRKVFKEEKIILSAFIFNILIVSILIISMGFILLIICNMFIQ